MEQDAVTVILIETLPPWLGVTGVLCHGVTLI